VETYFFGPPFSQSHSAFVINSEFAASNNSGALTRRKEAGACTIWAFDSPGIYHAFYWPQVGGHRRVIAV